MIIPMATSSVHSAVLVTSWNYLLYQFVAMGWIMLARLLTTMSLATLAIFDKRSHHRTSQYSNSGRPASLHRRIALAEPHPAIAAR